MSWRWIPESEQLAIDTPNRQLTIRWDEGDRGWFLSVIKPPRPATMGQPAQGAEVYICPLPLLCALVLVPREFHEHLTTRVEGELDRARGTVMAAMGEAAGLIPQPWPGPAKAADSLGEATSAVATVERLALDMAAAPAMED